MSRRNRRSVRSFSSLCTLVSHATEVMELRQVMSATTGSLIPVAMKNITVTAKYDLPDPGHRLEIDAVVVKDNTVHVFSTIHPPAPDTVWPQVITPAEKSLTVSVPNRDLAIEYHYGSLNSPSNHLNTLIHTGGATFAYRNANATDSTAWPVDESPTASKAITVTARYDLPDPGHRLGIDAVVVKDTTVHVFSTVHLPEAGVGWPQVIVPTEKSVMVTVPNREMTIEYHYGFSNLPDNQLYFLIHGGGAAVAYRNANATGATAWPINDIEESTQSPLKLDLRPGPAKPRGFFLETNSETNQVTVWFDERSSFDVIQGNRHIRQYSMEYSPSHAGRVSLQPDMVMDEDFFEVTRPDQPTRRFGGRVVIRGADAIVSPTTLRVKLRELPIFPNGATNTNALATEWSEAAVLRLPQQDTVVVSNRLGITVNGKHVVQWEPEENVVAYDVWIKSVKGDKTILRRDVIVDTELTLDSKLDPGDYRLWVRATRQDGSRTAWGMAVASVALPKITVQPMLPTGDKTPTIRWNGSGQASSIIVRVIDEAREEQAKAIRFASEAARANFITAYTATLSGNATEHELSTPITAGTFRAIVIEKYANGETAFGRTGLTVEAGPIARPQLSLARSGQLEVVASREPATDNYDFWVAYLGPELGGNTRRSTLDPQYGIWRFTNTSGPAGVYAIPEDAPAGRYRVWARAIDSGNGTTFTTNWSSPIEFVQSMSVVSEGRRVTWQAFPGATGYQITATFRSSSSSDGTRSSLNEIVQSGTSWTLPESFDEGQYLVTVRPLGLATNSESASAFLDHRRESEWVWGIGYFSGALTWNSVPGTIRYQMELSVGNSGQGIFETANTSYTLHDLTPRQGVLRIRALRSVNGEETWSLWQTAVVTIGTQAPTNVIARDTRILWDAQGDGVTYNVTIERNFTPNDAVPTFSLSRQINGWTTNTIDLAELVNLVAGVAHTAQFRVTIQAVKNGVLSASSSIVREVPAFLNAVKPIIEDVKSQTPLLPPVIRSLSPGGLLSIRHASTELPLESSLPFVGEQRGVRKLILGRMQLKVTDLTTGESKLIDESETEIFSAFAGDIFDDYELGLYQNSLPETVVEKLYGTNGIYQVQIRVQYVPVIVPGRPTPVFSSLTMADPSAVQIPRFDMAVSPWSEWSNGFEYAVLPPGKNVLPGIQPKETVNARPEFSWGVPQSRVPTRANYELWVKNARTGERVVHATVPYSNYRSRIVDTGMGFVFTGTVILTDAENIVRFASQSDLPPGTYHWWVRKVGDTGPRNGWSAKQTIEIVKAPVNVTMDAKTVDATPVISWQRVSDAESYTVELRSVSSGAILYSATEAANAVSHRVSTPQANGDYHVIVRALFANGDRSAAGKLASNGQLVPIVMTIGAPPENISVSQGRINWQAVAGTTRYQAYIQFMNSNGSVEKITEQDSFENSMELPAAITSRPGEHRIWIRAIRNEAGHQSTGRWSQRFVYHMPIASALAFTSDEDFQLASAVMAEFATSAI